MDVKFVSAQLQIIPFQFLKINVLIIPHDICTAQIFSHPLCATLKLYHAMNIKWICKYFHIKK